MGHSTPYIILLLFYIILSICEYKKVINKRKTRLIGGVVFVFFWGFRGYIGSDWYQYTIHYDAISPERYDPMSVKAEIGYYTLSYIIKKIGFDYFGFIFILTMLNTILIDNFVKDKNSNISLVYASIIVFFPVGIIDVLRNFLSICLFLQVLKYKDTKRFVAYGFFILSVLVHSSAVLFVTIYFLLSKRYIHRQMLWLLFFTGVLVYVSRIHYVKPFVLYLGSVLGGKYAMLTEVYVNSDIYGASYGIRLGIVEKIFFAMLVLLNYRYIVRNKIIPIYIFNSFFVFIFIYLYLGELDIFINRLTILFFYAYTSIIGGFHYLVKRKKYNQLIYLMICSLLVAKTFITFKSPIYRYSNVLFVKENYVNREYELLEYYKTR